MGMRTYTYRGITFKHGDGFPAAGVSVKHIKNLIDLADLVRRAPPSKFSMRTFGRLENWDSAPDYLSGHIEDIADQLHPAEVKHMGLQPKKTVHECGTVCCAVGTAAFNNLGGVKKKETWNEYSIRVFGLDQYKRTGWDYLFSDIWGLTGYPHGKVIDNSAKGAAARILHFIDVGMSGIDRYATDNDDGIPEFSDYRSDMLKLRPKYAKYKKVEIDPPLPSFDIETFHEPAILGSGWKDYGVEKPRA